MQLHVGGAPDARASIATSGQHLQSLPTGRIGQFDALPSKWSFLTRISVPCCGSVLRVSGDANVDLDTHVVSTRPGATVYTDDHTAYQGLLNHETVKHSVGEFVNGQAHTNGMESFWSMLKRGYHGVYHKMSPAHLDRYVQEFAGRQNQREADTLDQMAAMVRGMDGKRLRYRDLTA